MLYKRSCPNWTNSPHLFNSNGYLYVEIQGKTCPTCNEHLIKYADGDCFCTNNKCSEHWFRKLDEDDILIQWVYEGVNNEKCR